MDLLVFSHLRWDFVYQRPQHLLSRFARHGRVFFWEEAIQKDIQEPYLDVSPREDLLEVIVPVLPRGASEEVAFGMKRELLQSFVQDRAVLNHVAWYYTPMARHFTGDLDPEVVVYDCMDELSGFRGAPPGLTAAESELFGAADLVFTGGQSLYESKKSRHHSVHLFPSSIDTKHFAKARRKDADPVDQAEIPRPRIGYCGVIDERMDLDLLGGAARLRPDWHFVMVGPVVKISESDLPSLENIHYLGSKKYSELPAYMSGWDVGMLPFARNESTRFISPTKTPEYLAAGLPVVSTAITDVVRPYGERQLVSIAGDAEEFVNAVERLLARDLTKEGERLRIVDDFLSCSSWDRTFSEMRDLILVAASEAKPTKNVFVQQDSGNAVAAD